MKVALLTFHVEPAVHVYGARRAHSVGDAGAAVDDAAVGDVQRPVAGLADGERSSVPGRPAPVTVAVPDEPAP